MIPFFHLTVIFISEFENCQNSFSWGPESESETVRLETH